MKNKPRIGVTGPDEGGFAAWLCASLAVRWQGGTPIRIMPRNYEPSISLDGLIIGGGADVAPDLYGAEPVEKGEKGKSDHSQFTLRDLLVAPLLWGLRVLTARWWKEPQDASLRDALEKKLIQRMIQEEKPLLGICRGAQMLNIVCGGTLYQDLTEHYDETPEIRSILPRRPIDLEPNSRLANIVGSSQFRVNALHRQAVKELGEKLFVSARDKNGIIQAIEASNGLFAIGVQWHPEYLPQSRRQRKVFRALIEAAANRKA